MTQHLTLVTSDSPAILVDRLATDLGREPLPPFEDELIVVSTYGIRRWVKQELAKRHGCAASLQLDFTGKFCRDVARLVTGDEGAVDPRFTREAMTWRILDLLDAGTADDPNYAALQRFLSDDDARKRFGLASRLAMCLDDYQLYRPDVLLRWEATEPTDADATHERWQHALWRHLCADSAPSSTFATWVDAAVARFESDEQAPEGLPRRVSVFGLSAMAPHVVRLLRAIARFVPVRVYVVAPSQSTWRAESAANPLFAAFGGSIREMIGQLGGDITLEEHASPPSPRTTCLGQIRDDVRQGVRRCSEAGMEPPVTLDAADDSLTIHVCHSPMRELEVLRDQLYAAFAADPTLRPHDVLVLIPDPEEYAPFVEAVFDVGERELPHIPHRVADRPFTHDSSLAAAMLRMLQLAGARWTVPEIVELLDIGAVRRAAGISDRGAQAILQWVDETRIRWGRDGAMKELFGLPAIDANTWRAGIDRLLMGYATGRADDVVAGILPHAGDTVGDPDALGAFAHWLDRLFETLDGWRAAKSLGDWRIALRDAVTAFIAPDGDDEERAHATLLRAIDSLAEAEMNGGYRRALELSVVRDWIERSLTDENMTGGFLIGGMVIAALKPMRTIPFRIVAILGLGDDAFPRTDRRPAYDLLAQPRPGDHDRRAQDRQLFFDTIMSASDRLILSYVGRSARDNSDRAPSVVLTELLDIVDASFTCAEGRASGAITVMHHLQPFSPAYYGAGKDRRYFSYSHANARATAVTLRDRTGTKPFVVDALPAPAEVERLDIPLLALIECWSNPSEFFCRRVLDLRLQDEEDEASDCEPMVVDGLERYKVKDEIVRRHLAGDRSPDRERRRALIDGRLPPGQLAGFWFDRIATELAPFLEAVGDVRYAEPTIVDIAGPTWRITGRIDRLTETGRVEVRPAKRKVKDVVRAWITHLALCASAGGTETTLLTIDWRTRIACVPNAIALLDELVAGYREALRAPLPVFEGASWAYADRISAIERGANVRTSPIDHARSAFDVNDRGDYSRGDRSDPYVALCWRGCDPLAEAFEDFDRHSRTLWNPVFQHLSETALEATA